jgi:hypothetical protein
MVHQRLFRVHAGLKADPGAAAQAASCAGYEKTNRFFDARRVCKFGAAGAGRRAAR